MRTSARNLTTTSTRLVAQSRIAAPQREALQVLLEQSDTFSLMDWSLKIRMYRAITNLLHALIIEDERRADLVRALASAEHERDTAITRAQHVYDVVRAIHLPDMPDAPTI